MRKWDKWNRTTTTRVIPWSLADGRRQKVFPKRTQPNVSICYWSENWPPSFWIIANWVQLTVNLKLRNCWKVPMPWRRKCGWERWARRSTCWWPSSETPETAARRARSKESCKKSQNVKISNKHLFHIKLPPPLKASFPLPSPHLSGVQGFPTSAISFCRHKIGMNIWVLEFFGDEVDVIVEREEDEKKNICNFKNEIARIGLSQNHSIYLSSGENRCR